MMDQTFLAFTEDTAIILFSTHFDKQYLKILTCQRLEYLPDREHQQPQEETRDSTLLRQIFNLLLLQELCQPRYSAPFLIRSLPDGGYTARRTKNHARRAGP